MTCTLCPRKCKADRNMGQKGYCGCDNRILVSKIMLHMWEEPCISGTNGSGAVFFGGCSLRCVYCQNSTIALDAMGEHYTADRLAKAFLSLEERGAHNINLVTPTHFAPGIAEAVNISRQSGLGIPVVYNTGGYELVDAVARLKGTVDIYLTDFKYMSASAADKYSNAQDYPECAKTALDEMVRQQPEPVFDEYGILRSGVLVRHLLLPGNLSNSKSVVEYLYKTYGDSIYISLMNQYTPMRSFEDYPELSYTVTRREYDKLVNYALSLGVKNAYIQGEGSIGKNYIPDF